MTGKFKYFSTDPGGSKEVEKNIPYRLEFLSENELWVSLNTGGIARIDIKTGYTSHKKNNPNDQKSLTDNEVS